MTNSIPPNPKKQSPPIKVFDFFSGCGGTSQGFREAGLELVFAIDNDEDAAKTYRQNNPDVFFLEQDIRTVSEEKIRTLVEASKPDPLLFSGCAPCQPFTKQNTLRTNDKQQILLLNEFARFIRKYLPEYIFIENVPGLQKVDSDNGPFSDFIDMLDELEYFYTYNVISSQSYGVPQRRKRLVLIASSISPIDFPPSTHGPGRQQANYSTVKEWIGEMPALKAGEIHPKIPNHRTASLSRKNLLRIMVTPAGGSRKDWPKELILKCHSNDYKGHTDVYGRMKWNEPASGLTTKCISLSNGRFGHPDQDRAISVREAACLQTFPIEFTFIGGLGSTARQIGNAVPVLLAKCFGENFLSHYLSTIK